MSYSTVFRQRWHVLGRSASVDIELASWTLSERKASDTYRPLAPQHSPNVDPTQVVATPLTNPQLPLVEMASLKTDMVVSKFRGFFFGHGGEGGRGGRC